MQFNDVQYKRHTFVNNVEVWCGIPVQWYKQKQFVIGRWLVSVGKSPVMVPIVSLNKKVYLHWLVLVHSRDRFKCDLTRRIDSI